jgi:hypothetical protein
MKKFLRYAAAALCLAAIAYFLLPLGLRISHIGMFYPCAVLAVVMFVLLFPQTVKRWFSGPYRRWFRAAAVLAGATIACIAITLGFMWALQSNLSRTDTASLLELNVEDVQQEISDASDANLLTLAQRVAAVLPSASRVTQEDVDEVMKAYGLAEVNVVGDDGKIVASSYPDFLGFDMASGEQSSEFLVLLPGGGQRQLVQSSQHL